jgi:isoamylase
VEGPTDDAAVVTIRERQKRNFLATLFLSQGVPMLLAGDEIGNTQRGNNNAYCQDTDISWIDWNADRTQLELLEFTRRLIRMFGRHSVLHRRKFFQGRRIRGSEVKDLTWFRPDGKEMSDEDWNDPFARSLGLRLAGDAIEEFDERGNRIIDDTLLTLLNAHYEPVPFVLPTHPSELGWELILDTREVTGRRLHPLLRAGHSYELEARSLALFRLREERRRMTR